MYDSIKETWCVILNPHAGTGQGRKDQNKILTKLEQAGFIYELRVSEFPKHAIDLSFQAIAKGYRKLIVVGGDGTLNEVVNGIFLQNACPYQDITVGMIPVGTGNDWIKTFGIPNNYDEAIGIIRKGFVMRQDVGCIQFAEGERIRNWYFANMAGFGFDAMVASKNNQLKDKGRKGISLYLEALAYSFFNYRTNKTLVVMDGQKLDELIFSICIGIGKYNGGGMMQAPDAIPDNGLFQVTIIRKIGLWGVLRNLAGLYSGKFLQDHRVSSHQAKHISISSEGRISGEADGEILGENQFDIRIIQQKLSVFYHPEKYLKTKK